MKSKLTPFFAVCALLVFLVPAGGARSETAVPRFSPRPAGEAARPAVKGPRTGGPAAAFPAAFPSPPGSTAELNPYQRMALDRYLAGAAAVDDTLSIVGIQVQFSDSLMGGAGEGAREEVHDSTYFANELRHVAEYFKGASRGRLTIRWEVTKNVYSLPKEMGYYGSDELQDSRAVEMMESVIDSADADVDFSLYDTVMLIHAGAGQETDVADDSRVQLWSSFYSQGDIDDAFPDSTVYGLPTNDELGGEPFLVNNFMLVPESSAQDDYTIGSLGVWAFEVASRIGLLPLFDADPAGAADSRGAASYDLMAQGLFNGHVTPDLTLWPGFVPGFPSVFNRVLAGWVDPLVVEEAGTYSIRDINSPQPGDTACVKIPITESEYYLVVNRVHDTNFDSLFTFGDIDTNFFPDNTDSLAGAEFDFFLTVLTDPFFIKPDPALGGVTRIYFDTGTGMYIWHVDENVIRQMAATGHLPNDYVSQKGVDLEEADGVQDLDGLGDPFSFGSHFDSFRPGNNTVFGPSTKPATDANSGAATGITVDEISQTGPVMTCRISIAPPYEETRTRWAAGGRFQPPSLVDLDDAFGEEIVVLGDTANVYAFRSDGLEFIDRDGNENTIDPYITAPGARWIGAPAFGDIDGDAAVEIVACDERGSVYAWNANGTEVFDGDSDPTTVGVLYRGMYPIAGPPLLADVNDDGALETVFVEKRGEKLVTIFVNSEGKVNQPSGADFAIVWGVPIDAQACSPLSFGALGLPGADTEGIALVWADTTSAAMGFTYMPLRSRGDPAPLTPTTFSWQVDAPIPTSFPAASTIAIGDLDGTGFDEAVFTLPDGRMALYTESGRPNPPVPSAPIAVPAEAAASPWKMVALRSQHPSAPAVGDIDLDVGGTYEIALWDDDFFYVFEHNGELRTNWPQPLRSNALGDYPDLVFDERLVSPLILQANVDGGRCGVLFPRSSGGLYGFDAGGKRLPSISRPIPDGLQATPSVSALTDLGSEGLVLLGRTAPLVGSDAVADSLLAGSTMTLSIQTLDGAQLGSGQWHGYQAGLARQGKCYRTQLPDTTGPLVDAGSFKVYPNPVRRDEVHARIIVNQEASVNIEIYTLEGELAASRSLRVNAAEALGTPVDETIRVADLKSGIYMLRLLVESASDKRSFTANFAILR